MKISFIIDYATRWGQSLYICGDIPLLGDGNPLSSHIMNLAGPHTWRLDIEMDKAPESITYSYIVKGPEGEAWRMEWGKAHLLEIDSKAREVAVCDRWQDLPADKPYYSSAFTSGFMRRSFHDQPLKPQAGALRLEVNAPLVSDSQVVAVCGSIKALGNWDPEAAVVMNDARFPLWEVNVPLHGVSQPFEYKFLILDKSTRKVIAWENRDNRSFGTVPCPAYAELVEAGLSLANPLGEWRGAGTAIPVFSIRTSEDFGVGDFLDIKKMADFCRITGQKVLQLLPVNDTTMTESWLDSYPYKANSTFALHPMFIRPDAVGRLSDAKRREHYEKLRDELNALPAVDYERVNSVKNQYLREIYEEVGDAQELTADYKEFVKHNDEWLRPYAAWRALRDRYNTPDNTEWGQYAVYDSKLLDKFCEENAGEIRFHYFVQYHLDKQLRQARDYAHSCGVVLKGDIPIGISRTSVDAWLYPSLFNMNSQAGAPPDDFSVYGQNWGFPTYNWEEMARDGFAWWKARFRKMSEYFDAYRIDHILGFFRIWQIPMEQIHGLLGAFNPALPYSADDMLNLYGFYFDEGLMTKPLIRDWVLDEFFGDKKQYVIDTFLDNQHNGTFTLKENVDTQRKMTQYFENLPHTPDYEQLCKSLLNLIDDVLFVPDPVEPGKFHPRIAAQYTMQFRNLWDDQKQCFNRLYDDFFYHRNDDFWYGKAMWKLPPLLDSTRMLACAEDLGMIPSCVHPVMDNLRILSLEIQRMPKDPKVKFGDTYHYPYLSVCTTSTHDMPGLRAWWEDNPALAQQYFNEVLHQDGEAPRNAEPWICDMIVGLHLQSPSMLCILPLQDWLSIDGVLRRPDAREEQINEPANPTHYWRYRMHLTVERIMEDEVFISALREHISRTSR